MHNNNKQEFKLKINKYLKNGKNLIKYLCNHFRNCSHQTLIFA